LIVGKDEPLLNSKPNRLLLFCAKTAVDNRIKIPKKIDTLAFIAIILIVHESFSISKSRSYMYAIQLQYDEHEY
jgi:hypothetical protein